MLPLGDSKNCSSNRAAIIFLIEGLFGLLRRVGYAATLAQAERRKRMRPASFQEQMRNPTLVSPTLITATPLSHA
jgi:hypothetical protein